MIEINGKFVTIITAVILAIVSIVVLYAVPNASTAFSFRLFLVCITVYIGAEIGSWGKNYLERYFQALNNSEQPNTQQAPPDENAAPRSRVREVDPNLIGYFDSRRLMPVSVREEHWGSPDGSYREINIVSVPRRNVDNPEEPL